MIKSSHLKSLKILFFVVGLLLATNIYATLLPKKSADETTDASKSIMVVKDTPSFVIKLRSNPTTGYSWFLKDIDHNLLQVVGKVFHAANTKLVGAPGYEEWTFRVKPDAFVAPHVTAITLIYARPWDLSNVQTQGITFRVVTYDH